MSQRFKDHLQQLEDGIDVSELLPRLLRHNVLVEAESEKLTAEGVGKQDQNQALLKLMESKPGSSLVKFSECLRETPQHRKLSELLLPAAGELPAYFSKMGAHILLL